MPEARNPNERYGLFRTSVPGDSKLIPRLLHRLGATEVVFLDRDNFREYIKRLSASLDEEVSIESSQYSFESLTSPAHFMVREHFEDFHASHPNFLKGVITRVFNTLIGGPWSEWNYSRFVEEKAYFTPHSLESIEAVPRDTVGFEPYKYGNFPDYRSTVLAKYAIRAGSYVDHFRNPDAERFSPYMQQVGEAIAYQLEVQFGAN